MTHVFESSVGLPQELHARERCWSSGVMLCLNINGVGLDILLHIVTDTSINIIWAPNGFNRSDGATGKKLLWVWTDAESDGRSGNRRCPGCWPSFRGFFISALLSQRAARRWCQLDGGCLRQLLMPPLSAVPFLYVVTWIKDGSPVRERSVAWNQWRSHTTKTITMFCSALTFHIWYRAVHIETIHFSPTYEAILLCSARFCSYFDKRDAWRGRFSKVRWFPGGLSDVHPESRIPWAYLRKIQRRNSEFKPLA